MISCNDFLIKKKKKKDSHYYRKAQQFIIRHKPNNIFNEKYKINAGTHGDKVLRRRVLEKRKKND
jgi:hypothetical protein